MAATTPPLCISELQAGSVVANWQQTDSLTDAHAAPYCKGRGLGHHPAIRQLRVSVVVLFLGQKAHYYSFFL